MDSTLNLPTLSLTQRLARRQFFNLVQQLSGVGLRIREDQQDYFFGDIKAKLQADIEVLDPNFYWRLLLGGSIGAGEAWVESLWRSDNLTNLVRLFARCSAQLDALEQRFSWFTKPLHKLYQFKTRNTKAGSRSNIAAHYDLGNDLYRHFLDPMMQYSSAIFSENTPDLASAQQLKLERICTRLQLTSSDHLLEIGTGWGGLAIYAAKHYGCKVTTTTLSQEQFAYAQHWIAQEGLSDRIELLLEDYRDLRGEYDKIVSIEMIEAVGKDFLPSYFRCLNQRLKPHGQIFLQAITIADQRLEHYSRNTDFIQKYIFPGGFLPSISQLCQLLAEHTDMTLSNLSCHGHDYAKTLQFWAKKFQQLPPHLKTEYSSDFQKLWAFYFAYCEGGFLEGSIDLIHFHAQKTGAKISTHYPQA